MKNTVYRSRNPANFQSKVAGSIRKIMKKEKTPELFVEHDILGLEKQNAAPTATDSKSYKVIVSIAIVLLAAFMLFLIVAVI